MTDSTDTFAFGKFVPGFDFLRQLAQSGAGVSAPGLGIVPTVNVDELDKRIRELKAVQFWLEQNSAAVKATIQALEVQKMTLAALAGMNLNVAQMAKAFTAPAPKPAPTPAPTPPDAPAAAAKPGAAKKDAKPAQTAAGEQAPAGLIDPLQWWGALTQQFQKIATETMREAARTAPKVAKSASSSPAAKKAAAKKVVVKKAAARKAPAKKAAARKTAAKKSAPDVVTIPGWRLPPPFKLPG